MIPKNAPESKEGEGTGAFVMMAAVLLPRKGESGGNW